jgi:hypothetical protein
MRLRAPWRVAIIHKRKGEMVALASVWDDPPDDDPDEPDDTDDNDDNDSLPAERCRGYGRVASALRAKCRHQPSFSCVMPE